MNWSSLDPTTRHSDKFFALLFPLVSYGSPGSADRNTGRFELLLPSLTVTLQLKIREQGVMQWDQAALKYTSAYALAKARTSHYVQLNLGDQNREMNICSPRGCLQHVATLSWPSSSSRTLGPWPS